MASLRPSTRPDGGWEPLPEALAAFWTERHLCTLTTRRPDGRPAVVPVGVALDPERGCAWVIAGGGSRKVRTLRAAAASGDPLDSFVAACQVDGARWSTLEAQAEVVDDPAEVTRAVERYAARYRQPRENPERVALRLTDCRFVFGARLAG
ncbi:pyridoxamine 5'-phosphate oxidase family protein [Nocardioides bruguierae]|uniref:Pyridoxamine 5'-phosphate oxidase family protein n=1 Tax=Nocardioides bruguierae TaxID=2945102 RepID=A0A9X2D6J1_9ACTN|nr:pyridoxamine 5'-phosphate oxidase family protein [Nocardioides bruguierae]MCM0620205.1 pyridoxamine 5'-phosphate oxidase family protein [Nocardioides bruguierae]